MKPSELATNMSPPSSRTPARWAKKAGRSVPLGRYTRTITGPDGNAYAVTHDTNGAGTGWDSTV
jgi:hypothetical protein